MKAGMTVIAFVAASFAWGPRAEADDEPGRARALDSVPPSPPPPAPHVQVALSTRTGLVLQRRVGDVWYDECAAPCTKHVPLAGSYRVDGPGVVATPPFKLAASPTDTVTVRMVNERSRVVRDAGIVAMVLGGAAFTAAWLTYGAAKMRTLFCAGCVDERPYAAVGATGVALTFSGIVLAFGRRSSAQVQVTKR